MDPISHVLLGASLGYAVFGQKLGRTAALAGGLAAFVPDADVFIRSASDPLLAIEYHRHFTHALAFAPVGAGLVSLLWIFRQRWRPLATAGDRWRSRSGFAVWWPTSVTVCWTRRRATARSCSGRSAGSEWDGI